MPVVSRSARIIFNALSVLSLMLFSAATALWLDHRIVTDAGTIIRPFMQLEISLVDVTGAPTLLRTVDLSGQIQLPILGKMKAAGLTAVQLETQINQAFMDAGAIKLLTVSVRIVGFQPPGALTMSLLLAIPTLRVLVYCWSIWRKRRRPQTGLCAVCGYDVRATPNRCPECGTTVARVSRT
jgi:hypothetical protein